MICSVRLERGSPDASFTFPLELIAGDVKVVGRDPSCDFVVHDGFLSRRHFSLQATGTQLLIRDLGSRNGTTVNAVSIHESALAEGDVVRAGKSVFTMVPTAQAEFRGNRPMTYQPSGVMAPSPSAMPRARAYSSYGHGMIDEETRVIPPLRYAKIEEQVPARVEARQPRWRAASVPVVNQEPRDACGSDRSLSHGVDSPPIPEGLSPLSVHALQNGDSCYSYVMQSGRGRTRSVCNVLRSTYQIGLIVNQNQLDDRVSPLIRSLLRHRSAVRISETMLWLGPGIPSGSLDEISQATLGLDAMVLVGFRESEATVLRALSEFRHLLCHPSLLLDSITNRRQAESASLFRSVVFLLFEKEQTEDIYFVTEPGFLTYGTISA